MLLRRSAVLARCLGSTGGVEEVLEEAPESAPSGG